MHPGDITAGHVGRRNALGYYLGIDKATGSGLSGSLVLSDPGSNFEHPPPGRSNLRASDLSSAGLPYHSCRSRGLYYPRPDKIGEAENYPELSSSRCGCNHPWLPNSHPQPDISKPVVSLGEHSRSKAETCPGTLQFRI